MNEGMSSLERKVFYNVHDLRGCYFVVSELLNQLLVETNNPDVRALYRWFLQLS